jgi:hypothetical protein
MAMDEEEIDNLLDALPEHLKSSVNQIAVAEGDNLTRVDAASLVAAGEQIISRLDSVDLRVLSELDPFDASQRDRDWYEESRAAIHRARDYLDLADANRETAEKRSRQFAAAIKESRVEGENSKHAEAHQLSKPVIRSAEQARLRLQELAREKADWEQVLANPKSPLREFQAKERLGTIEFEAKHMELRIALGGQAEELSEFSRGLSNLENTFTGMIDTIWNDISRRQARAQLRRQRYRRFRSLVWRGRLLAYAVIAIAIGTGADQLLGSIDLSSLGIPSVAASLVLALVLWPIDERLVSPRFRQYVARERLRELREEIWICRDNLVQIRTLEGLMRSLAKHHSDLTTVQLLDVRLYATSDA